VNLNLGCGHNRRPGYLNVDVSPVCGPDLVCDLEALPWPWPGDSVDRVLFNHSLEHLGQDPKVFLGMMKELYRVCRHGAEIEINVPHPRHDHFIGDPTHVRAITPDLLTLFNRDANDQWKQAGAANTPFAHYLDVDFELTSVNAVPDPIYAERLQRGELTPEMLEEMGRELNNIYVEYRMVLRVRKSGSEPQ
jgi:SAM-dependent methyltransferase